MTDFRAELRSLIDACESFADPVIGHAIVWQTALDRARAALAQPAPPAEGEVAKLVAALRADAECAEVEHYDLCNMTADQMRRIADLLERRQPVPVSERLPEAEDCVSNPRTGSGQWCWGWVLHNPSVAYSGRWRMMRREWLASEAVAWLPAHALPIPRSEND